MTANEQRTERLVLVECKRQFADSRAKIEHCLRQLDDQQLWARLSEGQNSIANLLLHLAGNVRQWVVSGIGGAEDERDRPSEFAARGPTPRGEVVGRLDAALEQVYVVLDSDRGLVFDEARRIQGIETTVLAALLHTVTHFQGHAQEIICMTRYYLGDAYQFDFVPQGPEQGAAVE